MAQFKFCMYCGFACPPRALRCRRCDGWFPAPPAAPNQRWWRWPLGVVAFLLLAPVLGRIATRGTVPDRAPMNTAGLPVDTMPIPAVEITWCFSGDGTMGRATNIGPVPIDGLALTVEDPQIVRDNGFVLGVDHRRIAAHWQSESGPEITGETQVALGRGEWRDFYIERPCPFLPPPDLMVSYGPDPEHVSLNIHVRQKRRDLQPVLTQ